MLVQRILSGIDVKVSRCDACAADLKRKSAYAMSVQQICASRRWGRGVYWGLVDTHTLSFKVNVLPRQEHALTENQLGGPLQRLHSHFTFEM